MECRRRTGDKNLVAAMREALLEGFPDRSIGMGGVFHVVVGRVRIIIIIIIIITLIT